MTNRSKPQIGNASVARDAAQTELGEHRRPFASEGLGHRLGTMHDGCEPERQVLRQFDVRLDEHMTSNLSTTATTA